jgi:predicted transcriptional regulator
MEEIIELQKIVNNIFLVNIEVKSSKRGVVDARKVYSKILRQRGLSFQKIGNCIGKNHATIIHYIKEIDHALIYDKNLREKYILCRDIFTKKRKSILEQVEKDVNIYETVGRLTNELEIAISEKKQILTKFVDYLEQFEKTTGYIPSSYDLRNHVLPNF